MISPLEGAKMRYTIVPLLHEFLYRRAMDKVLLIEHQSRLQKKFSNGVSQPIALSCIDKKSSDPISFLMEFDWTRQH